MDAPYPAACAPETHVQSAVHGATIYQAPTTRMERTERATPAWLTERIFGFKTPWLIQFGY